MKAVAAIVAVLVLGDIAFAGTLIAHRATGAPHVVQVAQAGHNHPCNHGAFVSQAAHAKKHGQSNSQVATSNAGKDGSCPASKSGS